MKRFIFMKNLYFALCAALILVLSSCSENRFKVEGSVEGGGGKTLLLEKADFHGRWYPVDSVKISDSGKFSFSADAPASPEIYRLTLDKSFIYLPVDSVETISVASSASAFGSDFTLDGSENARNLAEFEKSLIALGNADKATLDKFKRDVYTKYIQNSHGSVLSYYVLTKVYDGKPLYDPADPQDVKYYAAVATQFAEYRPDDPHGKMVREASVQAMKRRNSDKGMKTVISAEEINMVDVALQNVEGKEVKLSDVVGKGKPVLLVFSMMTLQESPEFNRQLARLYSSRGGSVEIYQISFDKDIYAWRDAARNLPWINVIDAGGLSSDALLRYNVSDLPALFIYNSAGELVDRAATVEEAAKKL